MEERTITLSLTGPAAVVDALFNSFSGACGWTATVPDPDDAGQTIDNPVTQDEAVRVGIRNLMLEKVRLYNVQQAAKAARDAAEAGVSQASEIATLSIKRGA